MSAGNNIGSGREIIERFKTERNSLGLTDRELIEGLLSANCHGEDAKQCTDKLFVRFGSLTGILEAGRKKLESSGIVGSEAAALLDSAGRCVMSV